jgi:hypothetical protein
MYDAGTSQICMLCCLYLHHKSKDSVTTSRDRTNHALYTWGCETQRPSWQAYSAAEGDTSVLHQPLLQRFLASAPLPKHTWWRRQCGTYQNKQITTLHTSALSAAMLSQCVHTTSAACHRDIVWQTPGSSLAWQSRRLQQHTPVL